jgi:RNA polymerase sigma factor (sigma-70 family)
MTDAEYNEFVEKHRASLLRIAAARLRLFKMSPDDAEDFVHDALLRMWKHKEQVTEREFLEDLFIDNVLQLISNARKRKVKSIDPTLEALNHFTPATAEQAARYADDVEEAVAQIEDKLTRDAVAMVYCWQFTVKEASKLLHIGESALRMRLHRALPALRAALAGYAPKEPVSVSTVSPPLREGGDETE